VRWGVPCALLARSSPALGLVALTLEQGDDLELVVVGRLGEDVGRTQEFDVASLDAVEDSGEAAFLCRSMANGGGQDKAAAD